MLNLRKADSNSIKKCIVRSYLPHVNGQIYKKKKDIILYLTESNLLQYL